MIQDIFGRKYCAICQQIWSRWGYIKAEDWEMLHDWIEVGLHRLGGTR